MPVHSQLVGSSGFGLLRLLPPKHAQVEDVPPHLRRAGSVVLVRGLARHRTGLWDRHEPGLVGGVRNILGRTHRCRLRPSRWLWQAMRGRDRARRDRQLRARHIQRRHWLPDHGPLGPDAASLDLGGFPGSDTASLRTGRPERTVRHLLQLPGADGILGHGHDLHRPRRASYLQAGAELGAMGGA